MRAVTETLKIALGVAIGGGLVAFLNTNFHLYDGSSAPAVSMSYADLAAVNLTVATVVLGGVALIVGVAAIFGFQIIRNEAVTNAENRVLNDLPAMVEKQLRKMEQNGSLTQAMERAIYSGGQGVDDGSEAFREE